MINYKQYSRTVYNIIGAAMKVHGAIGSGLLESVYAEALYWELYDNKIHSEPEKEIDIYYRSHHLKKKYRMDMVVGDIIVELKSVSSLLPEHRAQVCNYLRLSRRPIALLINFGESDLKGERWAFDPETNSCFLVDKNMEPVSMEDIYLDFEDK